MPFDVRVEAHVARSPECLRLHVRPSTTPSGSPESSMSTPGRAGRRGRRDPSPREVHGPAIDYVLKVVEHVRTASWSWSRSGHRSDGVTYDVEPDGSGARSACG